jgi:hypothetical protein
MQRDKLDDPPPAEAMHVTRRSLLFGLVATGAFALPLLSNSTQAAVSMLRSGIDPDAVQGEVIPAGKKGGKGGGGRGGGGRGKGHGGGHKGRGRGKGHGGGHKGRSHGKSRSRVHYYHHYGRRRYGHGRYYGGYGWGCYNPWYRRRYWYRCVGWF